MKFNISERTENWLHVNKFNKYDWESLINKYYHYNDTIMGAFASQITSLTIVYSIVYSNADQREHQSSAALALVRGLHRGPVNSPHKWPVTRKMFPFDDVIMYVWVSSTEYYNPDGFYGVYVFEGVKQFWKQRFRRFENDTIAYHFVVISSNSNVIIIDELLIRESSCEPVRYCPISLCIVMTITIHSIQLSTKSAQYDKNHWFGRIMWKGR